MAFREVSVVVVREILRLWLSGHGYRSIARLALVDRTSARRYVQAAIAAGLDPQRGEEQLTEELLATVVAAIPPGRPPGDRGKSWQVLLTHKAFITARLDKGLTVVGIQSDLHRHTGVEIASRTLYRFCEVECDTQAKRTTVRIDDPEPGSELQVDFGRMGLLHDPPTQAGGGSVTPWCSPRPTAGICSCSLPSARPCPRSSRASRPRGRSSAGCSRW